MNQKQNKVNHKMRTSTYSIMLFISFHGGTNIGIGGADDEDSDGVNNDDDSWGNNEDDSRGMMMIIVGG